MKLYLLPTNGKKEKIISPQKFPILPKKGSAIYVLTENGKAVKAKVKGFHGHNTGIVAEIMVIGEEEGEENI